MKEPIQEESAQEDAIRAVEERYLVELDVAARLIPYVHHTLAEILYCEFWAARPVSDGVHSDGVHIAWFIFHSMEAGKDTHLCLLVRDVSLLLTNPPFTLKQDEYILASREQTMQALKLLLEWFELNELDTVDLLSYIVSYGGHHD